MPGNDRMHAASISAEIAKLAKSVEVMPDWKLPENRAAAMQNVGAFLEAHRPLM
jgi:hypothetical protein